MLQLSIAANASKAPSAAVRKLLWGNAVDAAALRKEYGSFDVFIGSELLYREDSVAALVQTAHALGAPTVTLAQQTRPAANMTIERACVEGIQREAGYRLAAEEPVPGTPAIIYTCRKGEG